MGICLSCLRGIDDDDQSQLNENSPLLHDGQNDYDKDSIMRKREEELTQIVNETNENLIDISSFFNTSNSIQDLSLRKSLLTLKGDNTAEESEESEPYKSKAKLVSNEYLSSEEKSILTELNTTLFALVEESTRIEKKGPLVASFD